MGDSIRLPEVEYPTTTIMMAENFRPAGLQFSKANAYFSAPGWSKGSSQIPRLDNGANYHGPGQNYLHCDGHVELLSVEQISTKHPDWSGGRWRAKRG
jgi:prepilin-type processing-associated H-X9-DG protein